MITSKLKVLSLFSGIGSFERSLTNLGIDYEMIGTSEWDVNAMISYDAIHTNDGIDYSKDMSKTDILEKLESYTFTTDGKEPCNKSKIKLDKLRQLYNAVLRSKNLGSILDIDETKLPEFDLMSWGFPCTDLSQAGKQKGFIDEEGNQTRSGLYYEGIRILKHNKPKYSIIENVKALTQKKFANELNQVLSDLEKAGYNNYYEVLNSKNYGVSQNRERIYIISICKDIDDKQFTFPLPFDNGLRLKDFLESNVDEKYYISKDKTEKLLAQLKDKQMNKQAIQINRGNLKIKEDDICSCLDANYYKGLDNHAARTGIMDDENNQITIPCLTPDRVEKRQNGRRFKEDGDPSFAITTQDKHGVLQLGNIVKDGNFKNRQTGRIYSSNGCSPTLNTCGGGGHEPKILEDFYSNRDVREYDDCPTLRADRQGLKVIEDNNTNELQFVGGIQTGEMWIDDGKELSRNYRSGNRVYDSEGIAVTQTSEGGGLAGYTGMYKVEDIPNPELVGGIGEINFGKQYRQGNRIYDSEKTAMCLLAQPVGNAGGHSYLYATNQPQYRIRKLTPRECFMLQGFSSNDFDKCKNAGISDSANYKSAGNSITSTVLMALFGELFNVEYKDKIKDIRAFYNNQIV